MSFNAFLYPKEKETRRILSYLFEIISKQEEEKANEEGADEEKSMFQFLLKQRMQRWVNRQWVLPQFLKHKRPCFLMSGRVIRLKQIDFARVKASKSKKLKNVYENMMQLDQGGETLQYYEYDGPLVTSTIARNAWKKGDAVKQGGDFNMLEAEEEDLEELENRRLQRKNKLFGQLSAAVRTEEMGGEKTQEREVRSLKELLRERETKMVEMERLQGMA